MGKAYTFSELEMPPDLKKTRLTRTLAMMKFGRQLWSKSWGETTKLGMMHFMACVRVYFQPQAQSPGSSTTGTCAANFWGGTDSSGICVPLGTKRKHPSLLMVVASSDDITGRNRE